MPAGFPAGLRVLLLQADGGADDAVMALSAHAYTRSSAPCVAAAITALEAADVVLADADTLGGLDSPDALDLFSAAKAAGVPLSLIHI